MISVLTSELIVPGYCVQEILHKLKKILDMFSDEKIAEKITRHEKTLYLKRFLSHRCLEVQQTYPGETRWGFFLPLFFIGCC